MARSPNNNPRPERVESAGPDRWRIRTRRELSGRHASAEVVVQAPADQDSPPHIQFAGARAWLALAEALIRDGQASLAIESARSGLHELGNDYSPPGVKDDTTLKVLAAEDLAATGREVDAAPMLITALETRTRLYRRLHAAELVD